MAAKNIDPLGDDGLLPPDKQSIEAGAQDWAWTCGTCHVGGGQMEYDRNGNAYSNTSPSGDKYVVYYPGINGANGDTVEVGPMSATNKAEMDCLLCHLDATASMMPDYNGRALFQTWGCNTANPIGPMADRNCDGDSLDANENDMGGMSMTAGYYGSLKAYDMYNRNFAVKDRSYNLAASMGAGAVATLDANRRITSINWGVAAPTLNASQIASVPKSANCAPCHARNDMTIGLPGMAGMKMGFGNYLLALPVGSMVDQDRPLLDLLPAGLPDGIGDTPQKNTVAWLDFGCKTGMGKRTHRIGVADPQGDNQLGQTGNPQVDMMDLMANVGAAAVYSPMNMLGQAPGTPVPNRMPDIDVHDRAGMSCGVCHYKLAASNQPGTLFAIAGQFCSGDDTVACVTDADCTTAGGECVDMTEIPAGDYHHLHYPAEKVGSMDHQFAQGDSFPDTKSKNNLDTGVSCESCHITKTHPRASYDTNGDGKSDIAAPTPAHAGFPALHMDKIACATCHVPEVYASPGRLKYRDWTVGIFKGGFRNMLDWNFDMVAGNHAPMPVMYQWLEKYGETKIYPMLPSIMPIFVGANTVGGERGSEGGSQDGRDLEGTNFPAVATTQVAAVKHRDSLKAAVAVAAANPSFDIRINGGNAIPLFDGFVLADSWEIDTAAEINAMITTMNSITDANATKLKLFQANFDVTHGIPPKEWALGGSKRGGCVSCHSSANPMDPNYNALSVGFFEGQVQPLNRAKNVMANYGLSGMAVGSYDVINNWFSMFANFDCTALCGAGDPTLTDNVLFPPMAAPAFATQCGAMSPLHGFTPTPPATLQVCTNLMTDIAGAALGIGQAGAQQMGVWDGLAGLQGFTVRETAPPTCNPMNSSQAVDPSCGDPNGNLVVGDGQDCCIFSTSLYTRAEVRSHWKIDLQQSYGGTLPSSRKVTWPVTGISNFGPAFNNTDDGADICQDQGMSTGNPFAPKVAHCCGADNTCGTPDDTKGMDGQYHIVTNIAGAAMLKYDAAKMGQLMSMFNNTGASSQYFNNVHEPHINNGFNCIDCHAALPAGAIVPADGVASHGSGNIITYTKATPAGATGVATFTFNKVGTAPCTQWAVNNADGIVGTADDYVCLEYGPAPVLEHGTCATACHVVGTVEPVNPPDTVPNAIADLGDVNDQSTSYLVKLDASRSFCKGDMGCSYGPYVVGAGGTIVGGNADNSIIYVQYDSSAARTVQVTVTDLKSGFADTETEVVNPAAVVVTVLAADFAKTVTAATKTVRLNSVAMAPTVVRAYIYWGDRKRTVVSDPQLDLAPTAAGINHVYPRSGSFNIRIELLDAQYNATTYTFNDDADLQVTIP